LKPLDIGARYDTLKSMRNRISIHVAALLFLYLAAPLFGQTAVIDPMIPHGETATYTVQEGDRQYTYMEAVILAEESTRGTYEFTYKTDKETVEIRVERGSMIPYATRSITVGNGVSIDSSTLVSLDKKLRSSGILVLSFTDLKYVLRGYPFGKDIEDLDVEFINTGDAADEDAATFAVSIRYKEIEGVTVNGRTIECHKLELRMSGSGIMRVIRPFIPKTYFWYSVEAPHYLVAYVGSSGFPGSAKREVELLDYSGWH
jgi:hypothetical protein